MRGPFLPSFVRLLDAIGAHRTADQLRDRAAPVGADDPQQPPPSHTAELFIDDVRDLARRPDGRAERAQKLAGDYLDYRRGKLRRQLEERPERTSATR
jgi:hypothetical protein